MPRRHRWHCMQQKFEGTCLNIRHSRRRTRCPKAMSKVITHPLLVRPSSATRGLIGVVPNQVAAAHNTSSCQVRMSTVKTRPFMLFSAFYVSRLQVVPKFCPGLWLLRPDRTCQLGYPNGTGLVGWALPFEKSWSLPTENPNLIVRGLPAHYRR